jgi:hypothetical protein
MSMLMKESLNSDGQHFHKYQQNEQSPLLLIHWTHKNTSSYDIGNPDSVVRQAHKCGGI